MATPDNIAFIITLPRSGSTMLQRILGSHSQIYSNAESWLLLPFFYAIRKNSLIAPYNAEVGNLALNEFLDNESIGISGYQHAISLAVRNLYEQACSRHNKTFFIDKTARNILITQDIEAAFPHAKLIVLIRNPLAIFASFLTVMANHHWIELARSTSLRNDLGLGFQTLAKMMNQQNTCAVHYENLVTHPDDEVKKICLHIGVDFEPSMIHYGNQKKRPGTLHDPKSVHKHDKPVQKYIDEWENTLSKKQYAVFARGFLDSLGEQTVTDLGYDFNELKSKIRPVGKIPRLFLASWDDIQNYGLNRSLLHTFKPLFFFTIQNPVFMFRSLFRVIGRYLGLKKEN